VILNEISIEDLSDKKIDLSRAFVAIPLLYEPVMKEFKKKELYITKLEITVNEELIKRNEVLLTLLRLFGIPLKSEETGKSIQLNYTGKIITVEFSSTGTAYSGICSMGVADLVFSENAPYIKILVKGESDAVIVLPEGSGDYYMSLDKKESEKEGRQSIIGKPDKLVECYNWLQEKLHG